MADDDSQVEDKPISIAQALKEGVKSATSSAATSIDDLDGASKSAVVLLAVGPEAAADVLRLLSPFEVQKLSSKMAVVRALPRELVIEVLRQFKDATANNAQVAFDTDSFMQNMLHKALGSEGASDLLGKLESAIDMSGVEALKRMEPDVLYEMIKNEHPQIIATVMVFLEPQHAAPPPSSFPMTFGMSLCFAWRCCKRFSLRRSKNSTRSCHAPWKAPAIHAEALLAV